MTSPASVSLSASIDTIDPSTIFAPPIPPSDHAPLTATTPSRKRKAKSTEPDSDPPSSSRAKPMDPVRTARLEARQARNRAAAQVSRDRKKEYLVGLETQAAQLRDENASLQRQLDQGNATREKLEVQVQEMDGRIKGLEQLVRELLKASVSALRAASPRPVASSTATATASTPESDQHVSRSSSETNAAPRSQEPVCKSESSSDERTRLSAREATCLSSSSLREGQHAQQRVPHRPTRTASPMAAASSLLMVHTPHLLAQTASAAAAASSTARRPRPSTLRPSSRSTWPQQRKQSQHRKRSSLRVRIRIPRRLVDKVQAKVQASRRLSSRPPTWRSRNP